MTAVTFVVAALAVYRVARLVVTDVVFETPRDTLNTWLAARASRRPAAFLLALLECEWCVAVHVAFWGLLGAMLVGLLDLAGGWATVVQFSTWWMALSALSGVLTTLVDRVAE